MMNIIDDVSYVAVSCMKSDFSQEIRIEYISHIVTYIISSLICDWEFFHFYFLCNLMKAKKLNNSEWLYPRTVNQCYTKSEDKGNLHFISVDKEGQNWGKIPNCITLWNFHASRSEIFRLRCVLHVGTIYRSRLRMVSIIYHQVIFLCSSKWIVSKLKKFQLG